MKQNQRDKNLVMPLREFSDPDGIAPSGIDFYTGSAFAGWKSDLFVTALRGYLVRLKLSSGGLIEEEETIQIASGWSRARDVTTGSDGLLYVVTDSGELVQLKPTSTTASH
jgi:glucose/arabinose dehydrogenase